MLIIPDAATQEDIDAVRHWVGKNPQTKYTNWKTDDQVIDDRWRLYLDDQVLSFIGSLVARYFSQYDTVWSGYQIQNRPHNIHIDEYGSATWPQKNNWTFIIAFDTVPEFKTIIWQEQFKDGASFAHWIEHHWAPNRARIARDDISAREDLEHTYDVNNQDYVCDYLTLEGIFQYQLGEAVLFDANKLHCTNNWRKYPRFETRELLQIHVTSNYPRFDI